MELSDLIERRGRAEVIDANAVEEADVTRGPVRNCATSCWISASTLSILVRALASISLTFLKAAAARSGGCGLF